MIISRMILKNWKNFSAVDVSLFNRMFLVGPNASGKSNLLDAIRFIMDIVKPGGGLEQSLKDRGGISKIRNLSARRNPEVSLEIHLSGSVVASPRWVYELGIQYEGKGRQRSLISKEKVTRDGKVIITRPDDKDKVDTWRLTQTYLEQLSSNQDFREIFTFFNSVRYIHIIPQLVRQPEVFFNTAVKPDDDFYGFHFLEQIVNTRKDIRKSRLLKIEKALKIAVPQLSNLTDTRDERGVPHLEALNEHWRPNAGKQREDQFSDGTIRLIAFLWVIIEANTVLLLEEPEMSLHPAIIKRLPSLISRLQSSKKKRRPQILLSTHSPDLLSDPGIGGEEILLFKPSSEGTSVRNASSIAEINLLLENGLSADEAVLPYTEPDNVSQLELFQ